MMYEISDKIELCFASPESASHFFGYYYNSPFDSEGKRVLSHRAGFDGRDINESDEVEIGFFDLDDNRWHSLGISKAVNWQQGTMLQWLGPEFGGSVIFNDRGDNRFVSKIIELSTGKTNVIDHPIYSVHPTGKYALTINYERMFFFRDGYNYQGVKKEKWNVPLHEEDGIFRIELPSGHKKLIIRTMDIAEKNILHSPQWLEHIIWNKSGSKFMFLHRCGSTSEFITYLYSSEENGNNLYKFPELGMYSHANWKNDTEFVIWAKPKSKLRKFYSDGLKKNNRTVVLLSKIYRFGRKLAIRNRGQSNASNSNASYIMFNVGSADFNILGKNVLTRDGHPSWTSDQRFMLTDTYADENGYRHLLLYDSRENVVHKMGKFFSQYNKCGYRCDLHPRFSRDENKLIIDSAHLNKRQILVFRINWNMLR